MSLFLDVWTQAGFILASDVRLTSNGEHGYMHKLRASSPSSKVVCAIAVCGDRPKACLHSFDKAVATKDTLREIAYDFAISWTDHFAGTQDYSAVHMVGFEKILNSADPIPQMWYWHNHGLGEGFYTEKRLRGELETFSEPVPFNNHIPLKAQEQLGKIELNSLTEERTLVFDYLSKYEPVFTWNGDNDFWDSVGRSIKSAISLLKDRTYQLNLLETANLAKICLRFLAGIGELLLNSTVGLSETNKCDVLIVTPQGIKSVEWADWTDAD